MDSKSSATEISEPIYNTNMQLNKLDPATIEALKTLSIVSSSDGADKLTDCNKLTASLEQIRSRKNIKLFEKLDAIKQDFSGLNLKIAKMEESILDLKKSTSILVKSLPSDDDNQKGANSNSARWSRVRSAQKVSALDANKNTIWPPEVISQDRGNEYFCIFVIVTVYLSEREAKQYKTKYGQAPGEVLPSIR